jgi:hypothetical protein
MPKSERYRVTSAALVAVVVASELAMHLGSYAKWVIALLGFLAYIYLIILTYRHLTQAEWSGGWIVLMILSFRFGPQWHGIHLSFLINLLPVGLAWFVSIASEANPQAT